jgi:hypothetical protein
MSEARGGAVDPPGDANHPYPLLRTLSIRISEEDLYAGFLRILSRKVELQLVGPFSTSWKGHVPCFLVGVTPLEIQHGVEAHRTGPVAVVEYRSPNEYVAIRKNLGLCWVHFDSRSPRENPFMS